VGFITPQNVIWIGIFDIFSLYLIHTQTERQDPHMTLHGYTYQIGDLFTTSKTGVTGRIKDFTAINSKLTRVSLQLANGAHRFAMVKTSK
jgi:hypothetical protein